jgi:hypothetical protein
VLWLLFIDGADVEVVLSDVMRRDHQIIFSICKDGAHVEIFASVPVGGSELELQEHIVDIKVSAFCQDDDVATMNHQLLDLTHITGDLFFVLQNDLVFLFNDQVLADRSCLPTAEYSIAVLPEPDELDPAVVVLLKSSRDRIFL